ncbi:MAG: two-component regulator propeller domain-containing protein [Cyclobacteriaceae bacterium]
MRIISTVILMISILSSGYFGFAGIDDYEWKVYNKDQDFLGVYIYTINQDEDGFLWIGSDEGLYRFDGKKLLNLNEADSAIENLVTASFFPEEGGLFFGYFKGGVSRFKHSRYRKIFPHFDLPGRISDIKQDHLGHVWALNRNKGLILVKEDSFLLEDQKPFEGKLSYCLETLEDKLFVGTNNGLLSFKVIGEDQIELEGVVEGTQGVGILSLFKDKKAGSNRIWIGTEEHGVLTMDYDPDNLNLKSLRADHTTIINHESILDIAEDLDNNLWVATRLNGLIKISLNEDNDRDWQYTHFNKGSGFESNNISSIYVDRENEIWVGTFGKGLVQLKRKEISHYDLNSHFNINESNSIKQLSDLSLLIGTDEGLLRAYNKGSEDSLIFETVPALGTLEVKSIDIDKEGKIWVGSLNGLFILSDDLKTAAEIPLKDVRGTATTIRYLTTENDRVWASVVANGVFELDLDGNLINHYATTYGFYHNEINHILVDTQERVWFGASSAGLAVKVGEDIRLLTRDKDFPGRDVNSIIEDPRGNIWIATAGLGVFKYDNHEFSQYGRNSHNLLSNYCNSLISDNGGNIWVSHRQGLSRIDHITDKVSVYTHTTELAETEVVMNSATLDDLGNIWFGNPLGITEIDRPERSFNPKTLNTVITDLRLFYENVDLEKFSEKGYDEMLIPEELVFPYDQNDLTFDYMAVHLKNPDHIYYQFQLVGHDDMWSPATQDNHATYTNLPPGDYIFKVRESDNGQYWSEDIYSEFEFRVLQPYWERWWFYAIEIVFILIVIAIAIIVSKYVQNKLFLKLSLYICIFIAFEFVHTLLEPYVESFVGGVPIFQVLLHLMLALALFQIENYITEYFKKRDYQKVEVEA